MKYLPTRSFRAFAVKKMEDEEGFNSSTHHTLNSVVLNEETLSSIARRVCTAMNQTPVLQERNNYSSTAAGTVEKEISRS